MLEHLPETLLLEILSLLPVKSLLRLKSVSKSWYNIIKSPYFIFKHLQRNKRRHDNCIIAQFVVVLTSGELEPHIVWLDDKTDEANTINYDTTIYDGSPPYNYDICGPCDGLYFVWCPWKNEYGRKRCLWNPALKEFKYLPRIILKPGMPSNITNYDVSCGFGFDPLTVDYKVISVQTYRGSTEGTSSSESHLKYPLSVMIYSLKNDSWRYVGDLSKYYYICENSSHTFVDSSFYWLGSHKEYASKYDVIIVVNLTTEAIEEIGLPETRIKGYDSSYSECLMVYHNSIALVALHEDEGSFAIWTLKKRSWIKDLSVSLDCRVRNPLGYYILQENMVLFGGWGELILYNLDRKESSVIPEINHGHSYCRIVSTYMETLVPLNDQEFWVKWVKH